MTSTESRSRKKRNMKATKEELNKFTRMRELLLELVPLVVEASEYPNEFGVQADVAHVCFPDIAGRTVYFLRRDWNTVNVFMEQPSASNNSPNLAIGDTPFEALTLED